MLQQLAMLGMPAIAYCDRCGRRLTNPMSVQAHMGPICRGKHERCDMKNTEDLTDIYLDIPLEDGIHLKRNENLEVSTNVPHLVIHHSPGGYEFAYGGSGPADLALNLAEIMLTRLGWRGERMSCYDGECFTLAWSMHQDLKWRFIATTPRRGGVIPYDQLEKWVLDRIPDEPEFPNGEFPSWDHEKGWYA